MRRALAVAAAAAGVLACAGPAPVRTELPPGHVPPAAAVELPADSNLVVSLVEAVPGLEQDTGSYAVVFVDGREAGRIPAGPRSQERRWGARLEPGNRLLRVEYWLLSPEGGWAPLDEMWRPAERFVRVDAKSRSAVLLKFYDGARRHLFQISREPLGR